MSGISFLIFVFQQLAILLGPTVAITADTRAMHLKDSVAYTVTNRTNATVEYYIGLQQVLDGEWRHIETDVLGHTPQFRGVKVQKVAKRSSVSGKCALLPDVLVMHEADSVRCRFALFHNMKSSRYEDYVVSNEFVVYR